MWTPAQWVRCSVVCELNTCTKFSDRSTYYLVYTPLAAEYSGPPVRPRFLHTMRALLVAAAAAFVSAAAVAALPAPPPLSSLAGSVLLEAPDVDMPVLTNAWGSTGTAHDVFSLSGCAILPYACALPADGTGYLAVDDVRVRAATHQWSPTSAARNGSAGGVRLTVEVRMAFEGYGVLLEVRYAASVARTLSLGLQGAVQRLPAYPWVTLPATDVSRNFSAALNGAGALVTCDSQSPACSAWALAGALPALALAPGATMATGALALPAGSAGTLRLAFALGPTADGAAAAAAALAGGWAAAWRDADDAWEARWRDAFTPKAAAGGHFSGSLPVLVTPDAALARAYYMGALALLQAERTNIPQFAAHTYVTAAGNAVFLGPPWGPPVDVDIGGAEQYAWDQAFSGTLGALLDPVAQRADLVHWNGLNFSQTYGIETDTLTLTGHYYAFNAPSLFTSYSAYLRVTNDSSLLALIDGPTSSTHYLSALADTWRAAARAPAYPLFADYSAAPDAYLECVPSYVHATAGLQAAAAAMALDLGDLRAAQGAAAEAAERRATAAAIAAATVRELYVSGGGWWRVLDTATGAKTEVRHVVDTVYTTAGLCGGGARAGWGCALSDAARAQTAAFAREELVLPSGAWLRALSPRDVAAPVSRPDHGTTGAYDAWAPLLFEALTALDGDFNGSLSFLRGVAGVARAGPFGQAHKVAADGASAYKPVDGWTRAVALNGASFAEVILRTVFGFVPPWLPAAGWRATFAPAYAGVPRSAELVGSQLLGIRLPDGGVLDATLTHEGVAFTYA